MPPPDPYAPLLSAASRLLDSGLSEVTDLGGGRHSTVLRCRTDTGRRVVVKAFTDGTGRRESFAAEAAGLALGGAAGPELLAAEPDFALVVLTDLGDAPTLADALLGTDPEAATSGLLAWARGLGVLAAGSVGRERELARLRAQYGSADAAAPTGAAGWIPADAAALPVRLAEAGVKPARRIARALPAELARIGAAANDHCPAFTPGDTCPDNNLLTPDGLRLIDFEAACFQSVFLTAAYCRMPFSSCWCVFRLPDGLAARIEDAFRAEVVVAYPELTEDVVWEAGVRAALAAWTVNATVALLPLAARQDRPMHRTRRPVPSVRELLRHRWERASTLDEFPALAATMGLLLAKAEEDWEAAPLPPYPAFRGTAGRGGST